MADTIEELRRAIDASGESRYAIARGSEVSESVLSRLVNGHRGVTIETAERILDYLDMELVVRTKGRKRKAAR